ncbi:MAG: hypothetical protein J1F23_04640 [Oscillospiraceae bacterium]|nr:hypothetical protein [Oscillospiraceae bacterium]
MRKRATKHRVLAVFLSICIILSMLGGMLTVSFAEDEAKGFGPIEDADTDGNTISYTIYISVDTDGDGIPDTNYAPGDPALNIKDGTAVEVSINWILNNSTNAFDLDLGNLGSLANGDGAAFEFNTPYSYTDGGGHGIELIFEEVDGHVIVHIRYTQECDCSSRSVGVKLEGNLDLDPREEEGKDDNGFKIGDQEIPYIPDYSESDFVVEKTHDNFRLDFTESPDGKFYLTYTVTNTVNGRVTGPVFYDDLPKGMTLVDGPYVSFDPLVDDFDYPGAFPNDLNSWSLEEPYGEHSFGIVLPENTVLYDGDVITYTYTVEIDKELVGDLINYTKLLDNVAYADSKEGNPEKAEDHFPGTRYRKPSLEKSGVLEDGYIEWTVSCDAMGIRDMLADALGLTRDENTGEYGENGILGEFVKIMGGKEAAEDFLRSLGIEPIVTDTIIGTNHEFNDGSNTFSFSIFDMEYAGDGKYIYTVRTKITDESVPKWENNVQTDNRTGDTGVVEPGYGIKKSNGTLTEDGTIAWTVWADLPGRNNKAFEYLDIIDIPVNSGDYPSGELNEWDPEFGWKQRVLIDTINIDGVPLQELIDSGEVMLIDREDGGFFIRILPNYRNRRANDFWKMTITFETEVYDSETGQRDPVGLNPFYHYENRVAGKWKYGDYTKEDSSFGTIEEKADYDYVKNYVSQSSSRPGQDDPIVDKFTQTWEIQVSKPLFFKTGNISGLFYEDILDMQFIDTLPAGTEYVEGSAKIVLVNAKSNYRDPNWVTQSDRLEDFFALLTNGLEVTENGDGTISISYIKSEEEMDQLRNDIEEFYFGRRNGVEYYGMDFLTNVNAEEGWYFTIRYETKVTDADTFFELLEKNTEGDGWNITFVNTVKGSINGVDGLERSAQTSTNFSKSLQKKYIYDGDVTIDDKYQYSKQPVQQFLNNGGGNQNIYFEIEVNKDMMQFLETDGGMLTLIDNMGSNLDIIPYSIQLTQMKIDDAGTAYEVDHILTEDEYEFSIDSVNNRITFKVPDGEYLILTYWASVPDDGNDNDVFNASNTIEIYGYEEETYEKSESPESPKKPSVTTDSEITGFSVYKYYINKNGDEVPLPGAQFRLEQYSYKADLETGEYPEGLVRDENNGLSQSAWDGVLKSYVDGSGNKVEIPYVFDFTNLPKGAIFCLTETAPNGYITADPIYFIFTNYDDNTIATGNAPSDVIMGLDGYDIQVFSYYETIRVENKPITDTVTFKGTKELIGREWNGRLDEGKYSFKLTALDGAPMPAEAEGKSEYTVTNTMHSIAFPSITYSNNYSGPAPWEYKYTISEVSSSALGVACDNTVYTVTVTVDYIDPNNPDGGVYVKDVVYTKEGDDEGTNSFEFVNTYETRDLTLSKNVTGSMGDKTKLFEFIITLTDGDGNPVSGTYTLVKDGVESKITFKNGKATVWLSHEESITVKDLPYGVHYEIVENDETYETKSKINNKMKNGKTAEGDLIDDTAVAFTNNLDVDVRTDATTDLGWLLPLFSLTVVGAIFFAVKRHRKAHRRRDTS